MSDKRSALERIKGSLRVYDPTGQNLIKEIPKSPYPVNQPQLIDKVNPVDEGNTNNNTLAANEQRIFNNRTGQFEVGKVLTEDEVRDFKARNPEKPIDPKLSAMQKIMQQMDELRQKRYVDSLGQVQDNDITQAQDELAKETDSYNNIQELKKRHEDNLGRALSRDEYDNMVDSYYQQFNQENEE